MRAIIFSRLITNSVLFIILTLRLKASADDRSEIEKVSRPFEYSGYLFVEYERIEKFSKYVEMSDEVKLAVEVHLAGGGPDKPVPAIMEYTPYTRAYIDIKNGPAPQS